ncbi:MAG TPA: hypothetical protein VFE58_19910 [Tepidisphaeraceae bacterium]|nr:hypothetical protein [Tepidisphaeraceae bacterium]
MLYILAIFLPSLAVLLCGRFFLAILFLLLHFTIIGWPLATLLAWLIINDHKADQRARRYYA